MVFYKKFFLKEGLLQLKRGMKQHPKQAQVLLIVINNKLRVQPMLPAFLEPLQRVLIFFRELGNSYKTILEHGDILSEENPDHVHDKLCREANYQVFGLALEVLLFVIEQFSESSSNQTLSQSLGLEHSFL